jgi:hypothetical protein
VGGHYWALLLAAMFVLTLLYLGWRGGRRPFPSLLLVFHLPLAVAVSYAAWRDPQGFRFEGATVGIDLSLAVIGPLLFWAGAVAAIVCRARCPWARDRQSGAVGMDACDAHPPGPADRTGSLQVVLFHSGGIQSWQNVAGVALVAGSGCCQPRPRGVGPRP